MEWFSNIARTGKLMSTYHQVFYVLKVIRKFFLNHDKDLDDISGIAKNIFFFPFEGL